MKVPNRQLTAGPKLVAYHEYYWHRLQWTKVVPEGKPYEKLEYWQASYRGRHVADFFEGKSGRYFAVVFGRRTFYGRDRLDILHLLTGLVVGPQH